MKIATNLIHFEQKYIKETSKPPIFTIFDKICKLNVSFQQSNNPNNQNHRLSSHGCRAQPKYRINDINCRCLINIGLVIGKNCEEEQRQKSF